MQDKREADEQLRVLEKLLARMTEDANGCWIWDGARTGDGYGGIWLNGEVKYVHRIAAALFLALDRSSDLYVLHECDNRACFNPAHLRLGTQADNMLDAARKGRMKSKLTREDVVEIKRLLSEGQTHKSIGERYGVTKENIGQIARGKTWKHVPDPTPLSEMRTLDDPDGLASAA